MGKVFSGLICAFALIFLISFASAQLTFNSQPNTLYNVGDVVDLAVNIVTASSVNEFFSINLICNGIETQVQQQPVILTAGQQVAIPVKIPLIINFINGTSGTCKLKAILKDYNFLVTEYALTNEFRVSDFITATISSGNKAYNPGENVFIAGNAVKENGENVNGFAGINVTSGDKVLYSGSGAVNNGYFYFNFTLPSNAPSGPKLTSVRVYEIDSSAHQTNKGFTNFNIQINQIPTTLDLVSKDSIKEILPGRTYNVKAVLYDQAGDKIDSAVNFTIMKSSGEVMGQERISTDEFLDVPISYNDAPDTWKVFATSNGLNSNSGFNILRNEIVSVELINKTLLVTNKGNVPYNNPIQITLGDKSLAFNVSLGIDESRKYVLTAPKGDYSVEVLSGGNNLFSGSLFLTGNAINIQEASEGVLSFLQNRWVWSVILLVLVFVIFFFFRKWHKKRFFKKINMNKKFRLRDGIVISGGEESISYKNRIINSRNVADLSLSIQGEKQNASIVCVNIKNFGDVRQGKGGVNETMNRLRDIVDDSKAAIYENGSYLFFIFAPAKTKAFNNELTAIETAEKMQRVLQDHNRLLKQKIEFGISVNFGSMVAKQGLNSLKFMSLGSFISTAKKLAYLSKGEIFLSNEIKNRTASDIKTEKHSEQGLEFYTLVEIRNREKSQKFIREFMSKMEKEEKESNRKFFE
jgi:hypothetical protein